ncbi:restriction endonuclease subunit S [Enterococcus faecalis]|uniref:restriction endonuclease subunit S n=1 Tax=Enterococcus faecalis TaxID=1351 RepID=UPI002091B1EA|nr:restriction endonuclease subunit S [Enterococcus faecalis]MCO5527191.1 restriction endonuclease subunit S [Enterococcus faecalis]MCU2220734.1 restriction endonuclease subunit S [Enterococcus faecalis]
MKKVPRLRFRGFSEDWELCKLGEESDVRDGTHDSPKYFDDGYPLVTSKNLKDFGLDLSDVSLISYKDFKSINKRSKVDIGDILFGMIGTIGNPVQIFRDDFAIKNVALIKEQRKILNGFLIHILKSPVFDRYIRNENAGGTQKFLALSKVRGFEFLRPNIEEQVRIGNLFKQIDNTITLHQRKLDQLKELKKAYLQVMFVSMNTKNNKVPKLRFTNFKGEWEQRKLGNISKMYQPQTITGTELLPSGYPVFGANGYIGFYSEMNHENDQVTISARGEGTGTINYVNGPVWITGNSMVINVNDFDINKRFLHANLSSNSLKKYITGGAQPQLTRDILTSVPIKLPNIFEQNKIGLFFKQLDETVNLHQNKLTQLKSLKKSYLQNMFI